MANTCPSCENPAEGRFCSHCGVALDGAACAECGSTIPPGGRFCNQCGAPSGATRAALREPAPSGAGSKLPWVVAGLAVVALAGTVVASTSLWSGDDAEPALEVARAPQAPAGGGMPSAEEIASMGPREAADRLFNRVMTAVSAGDSAQARMFLPMALSAYQRVPELDLDGRYHVAVLQLVGQDAPAARVEAARILEAEPNHLLGLFTAAEAERMAGDPAAARALYQRFLDSYDAEIGRQLPEYVDHARLLPTQREEARKYLAGA